MQLLIVVGKVFWDVYAVLFEISVSQSRNLLERFYGQVNDARYPMPCTSFVRISKTFSATIGVESSIKSNNVINSIEGVLKGLQTKMIQNTTAAVAKHNCFPFFICIIQNVSLKMLQLHFWYGNKGIDTVITSHDNVIEREILLAFKCI